MKILVLGGTGAMGMYLVKLLAERGENVTVTTRKNIKSDNKNISYVQGNAMDYQFICDILKDEFDVVIDFMVYTTEQMKERVGTFLNNTKQYVFISSARVYADSSERITENSARLLDSSTDTDYLKTDEYALKKAREENMFINNKLKNWTIIRPYITYGKERLQLGVFEKEHWLYRALHGRTIIFSKDVAEKMTSFTYGFDVAKIIAGIAGNEKAKGEILHTVTPQNMTWGEILNIYLDVIEEVTGNKPKVILTENSSAFEKLLNCKYQLRYDRLFNRCFDSSKAEAICGDVEFTDTYEGIKQCILEFTRDENPTFRTIFWDVQAYMDRLSGERTQLSEIKPFRNKLKYLLYRYTPYMKIKKGIV